MVVTNIPMSSGAHSLWNIRVHANPRDIGVSRATRMQSLSVVELIAAIARSLVDKPNEVSIDETSSGTGTLLHLRVDPTDVGKVIGKQRRTARSLRTVLGAVSVKLNHLYSLEIIEDTQAAPDSVARD